MYSGIVFIERPLTLYRNDILEPPKSWRNDFKSPSMNHKGIGDKNKSGHFFLTDSIDIARDTVWLNKPDSFYLTECHTTFPIKLIDFTLCMDIFEMVDLLMLSKIDILTSAFKTYENSDNTPVSYDELRDGYYAYKEKKGSANDQSNGYFRILNLYKRSISVFGQRLTDFENGQAFVKAIDNIPLDPGAEIDGYRWREYGDLRGFTYCFFNSDKLSSPVTQFIESNPLFLEEE